MPKAAEPVSGNPQFDYLRQVMSSDWEQLMRFRFLAELLEYGFVSRGSPVTVLSSGVDSQGYDVVLVSRNASRFVQLKTCQRSAWPGKRISLNQRLLSHQGGCAIVLIWEPGKDGLAWSYGFLEGRGGGSASPFAKARSSRGRRGADGTKKLRPWHRDIPSSRFAAVKSIGDLYVKLFGADNLGGLIDIMARVSGRPVPARLAARPSGG